MSVRKSFDVGQVLVFLDQSDDDESNGNSEMPEEDTVSINVYDVSNFTDSLVEELEAKLPETNIPIENMEGETSGSVSVYFDLDNECNTIDKLTTQNFDHDENNNELKLLKSTLQMNDKMNVPKTTATHVTDNTLNGLSANVTINDVPENTPTNVSENITIYVVPENTPIDDESENTMINGVSEKRTLNNVPENTTQVETTNNDNAENESEVRTGRKKLKDPSQWQKTVRKRKRQSGKEYTSSRGKRVPRKVMKLTKDCKGHCRYKCGQVFTQQEAEDIHRQYWSLSDNEKYGFYAHTTERVYHKGKKENAKRLYTYRYFFEKGNQKIQVCKDFYLCVLQVNDKRVRGFYEKLDKNDGNQFTDMRGKNNKSRTNEDDLKFVREHIRSFPRVPSHYCRSSTSKEFLEADLSMAKMFDMYCSKCKENDKNPLKICMYRKVFTEEFNIGFQKPKKDRCDLCEEMRAVQNASEKLQQKYHEHVKDKIETKDERDADRSQTLVAVVSFDLENVITLPRANVSNFFYKRKLNTFNLTAHSSIDNAAYNAIWSEALAGRGANEIASALVTILRDIKHTHKSVKSFVLWSDSCVPQNRNSIMSFALKRFMIECDIDEVTQKFCCPGHSSIQEVDNIHSHIEKVLKVTEIFSPVSLLRVLKNVRRKNPFKVIQMKKHNFFDHQKCISGLRFSTVPYTKVKCLRYQKIHPLNVQYKLSFKEWTFRQGIIENRLIRIRGICADLPVPRPSEKCPIMSKEKKKDLTDMLKYMSEIDRAYFRAVKLVLC